MNDDNDDIIYYVVVNHEEQYSIWPTYKEIPKGWKTVGKQGSKQECLDYINEVWVDMRPLSLRKWMEEHKEEFEAERLRIIEESKQKKPEKSMSATVTFLSKGLHPISAHDKTLEEFKQSLARGYVLLTFTDTRGGTCLGIKIEPLDLDLSLEMIHLEGSLILDYVRVKLLADISLSDLQGTGSLQILEEVTPSSLAKERELLESKA